MCTLTLSTCFPLIPFSSALLPVLCLLPYWLKLLLHCNRNGCWLQIILSFSAPNSSIYVQLKLSRCGCGHSYSGFFCCTDPCNVRISSICSLFAIAFWKMSADYYCGNISVLLSLPFTLICWTEAQVWAWVSLFHALHRASGTFISFPGLLGRRGQSLGLVILETFSSIV